MSKIKQQNTSQNALQKAEDNKKEITYIYSKLKNLTNELEQVKNNSGTNYAPSAPSTDSANNTDILGGSYLYFTRSMIYFPDDFSKPQNTFYFNFYSQKSQQVHLSANFQVYFTYVTTTTDKITYSYYLNGVNFHSATVTYTSSNATQALTNKSVFFKKGLNQFKIVVDKPEVADTFYLGHAYFYIYGAGLNLINDNGDHLDMIYSGDKNYLCARLSANSLTFYVNELDKTLDSQSVKNSNYVYSNGNTGGLTSLTNTIIFNQETLQYEFDTPIYYWGIPTNSISAKGIFDGYSYFCPSDSIKCAALAPTTDPELKLKGICIDATNKAFFFTRLKSVSIKDNYEITSILSELIDISTIVKLTPVKVIDSLFLDREICFCCHTNDGNNYLIYNIENDNPQIIPLGIGGNVNLYYHNKNIFYFINKNNACYVNFLKYDSISDSYELLDNETCLGAYYQIFASDYETWYYRFDRITVVKLDFKPVYNFE